MPMLERPISKAGWTRVAFGDVVRLSKARVADPEAAGIERVVGLEHIEPGDLRIRRWGDVADGTTFTTLFKPGQVLFGKRRAYQRKVAVADFEGVCSGDIYVLEPANDRLMPELLPFLCQTDAFFDHAVGTSAGSLSPRTNWTSLASFEFLLPPIQEQARLVDALSSARDLVEKTQELVNSFNVLYEATSLQAFSKPVGSGIKPTDWRLAGWQVVQLGDLIASDAPICYGIVQVGEYTPDGVPTLAIHNLSGNFVDNIHRAPASVERAYQRSRVAPGDVVISIKGTIGEIALVPQHFAGNLSRELAKLRFNRGLIDPQFFLHLYASPAFRRYTSSLIVGSTRAELSIDTLRKMQVPVPDLSVQAQIVEQLDRIQVAAGGAKARLEAARRTIIRLIEAALSGVGDQ
ncbi:restriction endonuclease subunit S [Ochrobactrum sp. 695/2009]|nr:restriction endonuclease subunit S [Ochrobactrum sp. 721/2009]PJT17263.1 restriction endonuclease subunit S [Ochrobactrum sp. 720/2009]PJT18213.1 restriction endonuclease subunit S [Ochrobactrum sp. 715/2009]PJT30612.1 restriction endonuclease subunit S [Ochrobactrum sp. 695/2009]PJT34974.1 restriction endonuclease subunit S [Ochrobactrum sp. 689/2009]